MEPRKEGRKERTFSIIASLTRSGCGEQEGRALLSSVRAELLRTLSSDSLLLALRPEIHAALRHQREAEVVQRFLLNDVVQQIRFAVADPQKSLLANKEVVEQLMRHKPQSALVPVVIFLLRSFISELAEHPEQGQWEMGVAFAGQRSSKEQLGVGPLDCKLR